MGISTPFCSGVRLADGLGFAYGRLSGILLIERYARRVLKIHQMNNGKARRPLLIVDDEVEVLASLKSMFRRHYTVYTAHRAEEALQILREKPIHVVVTDQRMPGMTGTDFLAKVSEEFPDVVRLMITGYADIESVIEAINRGHVYRYISKPWDPAELESMVRQAQEQYELVDERKRLLRELQEANQLKTAFITIASHELNTPLTIVLGMLDLALGRCDNEQVRGYLGRAQAAARRLLSLLTNTFKLLQQNEFHRSLERGRIHCEELFKEIFEDVGPFARARRQELEFRVDPPDLSLMASRVHLRDVLENLVTNAIKFSADGSKVQLLAHQEGDNVCFEVIDSGVGIRLEDQPHVFEPLFSTWDTMRHSTGDYGYCKRGMGLGLAIVKKFVEMHGGTIGFESRPGEGTTFRIVLPMQ